MFRQVAILSRAPKGAQTLPKVGAVPSAVPSQASVGLPSAEAGASQQSAAVLSASVASNEASGAATGSTTAGCADQSSLARAEALAKTVLQEPLGATSITKVFELLPDEPVSRSSQEALVSSKTFSIGLYVHGGVVGFRKYTFSCPHVAELLNKCVHHCAPQHRYTTISLFQNVLTGPHQDSYNGDMPNLIVPLTNFEGGSVFLEDIEGEVLSAEGHVMCGHELKVSKHPFLFDAKRCKHFTGRWRGLRLVLVAFSACNADRLPSAAATRLSPLGFRLPSPKDGFLATPFSCKGLRDIRHVRTTTGSAVKLTGKRDLDPEHSIPTPVTCEPLLFVEACCGSAALAAAAKQAGFEVMAIDHPHNRHNPAIKCIHLDLRAKAAWVFLDHVRKHGRLFHFHISPPCGTASRARELPNGPGPLRSFEFPYGIPGIPLADQAKVTSANEIYSRAALFCIELAKANIGFTVENPSESHMWLHPAFGPLLLVCDMVHLHSCMYGGARKKSTCFATNVPILKKLALVCDGAHPHKKWGKVSGGFATAEEAAFPVRLCDAIVSLLVQRAGFHVRPFVQPASAVKQPRSSKCEPFVPEYKFQVTVPVTGHLPMLDSKNVLTHAYGPAPKGSRLLRFNFKGGSAKPKHAGSHEDPASATFGVYRQPQEFLQQCLGQVHPFDLCKGVPDSLLRVMAKTLLSGPVQVMKERLLLLKKWGDLKAKLARAESELHASLEPSVAKILEGKNLLLLEQIAGDLGWPDTSLHREMREGFKITGMSKPSGVFDLNFKPPDLSESELAAKTKFMKPAIWARIRSESPSQHFQALWDLTCEEAGEKAWLRGPLSWDQLHDVHGEVWMPSRRFPLIQKGKLRPIDDLSESCINASYGVSERLALHTLDEVVWCAMALTKAVFHSGLVDFTLADGARLQGELHEFWKKAPDRARIQVKTVDLKAAYKQLPLHPDDRRYCTVCLQRPQSQEAAGFISHVLPFGGTASVIQFNRVARLLQRIMHEATILAFNYYDDYPLLELSALARNADVTVHHILKLLGFGCSEEKEAPFARAADCLGVRLDFLDDTGAEVRVANRPEKAEEVSDAIRAVLKVRMLKPREAPSLFGRIQFTEGQLMGRQGRLALADLRAMVGHAGDAWMMPCVNSLPGWSEVFRARLQYARSQGQCMCSQTVHVSQAQMD